MNSKSKHVLWRRKIMQKLTRHTGQSTQESISPMKREAVRRVLICRPNHRLGNMLLITPLVKEVACIFPDAKMDIFVKGGIAPIVFKNFEQVDRILMLPKKTFRYLFSYLRGWTRVKHKPYDLVVNVVPSSASGRIATNMARTGNPFFGEVSEPEIQRRTDYKHIAKGPVYALRTYLSRAGIVVDDNQPVPLMDMKLNKEELERGNKVLRDIVHNDKRTIGLFTYATEDKLFSKDFWIPFYEVLKEKYPDYNIVEILPKEKVSQIDFKAPSYYSRDLREIGAFMAATEIFIGADSGMMHLASASLTPTVGLFSVTDAERYGPYGNGSRAVKVEGNDYRGCLEAVDKILRMKRPTDK